MLINWHGQSQTYMNRTFVGTIRTGQTQAVSNWLASLSITRRTDDRYALDEAVGLAAMKGAPIQTNVPECDLVTVGGRQFAVVYGVKGKGETIRGRTYGEFRFVVCMADEPDERLLVTDALFELRRRYGRRTA